MSGFSRRLAALGATAALCAAFAVALATHGYRPAADAVLFTPHPPRRAASATRPWPRGTVDVNTATRETLLALTGIGPVLADAILAERAANGPFDYPEDLLAVKGIGAKTLARFRAQLWFSGEKP